MRGVRRMPQSLGPDPEVLRPKAPPEPVWHGSVAGAAGVRMFVLRNLLSSTKQTIDSSGVDFASAVPFPVSCP